MSSFQKSLQWNFSNLDTNGAEESVLFSEVLHARVVLGVGKGVLLERCLQFRGVLIEVPLYNVEDWEIMLYAWLCGTN